MKESETAQTIDKLARRLVRLRFDVPALFFLEAHIPFVALFHTAGLLFEPIATPFFGAERIATFQNILSDRTNLHHLMERIEFHRNKGAVS